MRKGSIFTVDALISLIIFTIVALHLMTLKPTVYETRKYQKLSYVGSDVLRVLSTLRVNDIKNESFIKELLDSGTISDSDLNKTVLDLIGSLWEANHYAEATNIVKQLIQPLVMRTKTCVRLSLGNETIYSSCTSPTHTVAVSTRLQTGYEIGKPVSGYIARAWARKARKNTTLIVKGDVITSSVRKPVGGNNGNKVNITYDLYIPEDAQLLYSYWFIETAWTDNKFKAYINGEYIPGSDGQGSKTLTDLNSYLHPGYNTLTIVSRYGYGGLEGGDDGASHFVLNYSTSLPTTFKLKDKFYFATVVSNCSIRYKKPIFVPGDISGILVNLTVEATNVTLKIRYEGVEYLISTKNVTNNNVFWTSEEIEPILNENGIYYSDLGSKYFWVIVDIDTYHSREEIGPRRAIYNSSYVMVNATYKTLAYGYIDLTKVVPVYSYSDKLWGDFYRTLEWRFSSVGKPLYVDSQLAWLYFSGTDPNQNISANSIILYQHPPQPFIPELARWGYINISGEIKNGTNVYRLEFGDGYGVNPFNSLVDFTFLIPSQVGYGDVFNTSEEAVNDARQRLLKLLEGSGIKPEEIVVENKTVHGIRWLWGPSLFRLETWEP